MKQSNLGIFLVIVSVLGILILNSAFIVDQTEQVVITQFGEPIGSPIKDPGLHWKIPFIQTIHKFDSRILEWDGYSSQIPTKDKKFIWVEVTGRWRIESPLLFLKTVYTERNAQSRLDGIMDGITRNFITRHNIVDVIRSTDDILKIAKTEDEIIGDSQLEKIEIGRDEITRQILMTAKKSLKDFGIELIDLRITRVNYIDSVLQKVFERMISERKRAAEQLRSEGQGIRAEIEGQKGKDLKKIESEAYRQAQKIKGSADAESTKIYGDAYSKDLDYYTFVATLEKYPATLKNARVVLSTDSDFVKYLKKVE